MKFCEKCGKEIIEGARFCNGCGAPVVDIVPEKKEEVVTNEAPVEAAPVEAAPVEAAPVEAAPVEAAPVEATPVEATPVEATPIQPTVTSVVNNVKKKVNFKMTKKLGIVLVAVAVAVIIIAVVIANAVKLNKYGDTLETAYSSMSYGAEQAESYASLQSKVWRNCIYKESSTETDKYTKNDYGLYYSDFNDALQKFYDGESLTYSMVSLNVSTVNGYMSELKDCPDKFEDEYKALKEMYVAYSDLTDLVVGDSTYSWNTFNEALESAKSNYKSAKSSASLMIE